MSETAPQPQDLSFGEAINELEGIVAALEGGQLELEDSLTRYERGVSLLRALQSKLADAQQKVTVLIGELESEGDAADALSARPESTGVSGGRGGGAVVPARDAAGGLVRVGRHEWVTIKAERRTGTSSLPTEHPDTWRHIVDDCIFCKIGRGEASAAAVYEDDLVVAFDDVSPQAPVHTLIVPRDHYEGPGDGLPPELMAALCSAIPKVAEAKGVASSGYRVILNVGRDARQSVQHMHIHVLGGKPMSHGMVNFAG